MREATADIGWGWFFGALLAGSVGIFVAVKHGRASSPDAPHPRDQPAQPSPRAPAPGPALPPPPPSPPSGDPLAHYLAGLRFYSAGDLRGAIREFIAARRFPPLVERWRSELARRAGDIPVDALLAWILIESGGNLSSTGLSTEVGPFQLNLAPGSEDHVYGATLEGLRDIARRSDAPGHNPADLSWMSDADLDQAIGAGVRKVAAARNDIRRILAQSGLAWPENSYDFGSAVKQVHALPSVIYELMPKVAAAARAAGAPLRGWNDFHQHVMALPANQTGAAAPYAAAPSQHHLHSRLEDTLDNAEIAGSAWGPAIA